VDTVALSVSAPAFVLYLAVRIAVEVRLLDIGSDCIVGGVQE
jgi:hypothetical protein